MRPVSAFQTTFREVRYKRSVHLLVVEDDPRLGRLLSRLFANDRHVVDLATAGQEAIELVAANPGFDAVVLDVGLPGMDGFDVARRLRASGSRVPILMLTARDGLNDRVTGSTPGRTTTWSSHSPMRSWPPGSGRSAGAWPVPRSRSGRTSRSARSSSTRRVLP